MLALLRDERVALELVADGVHLHPSLAQWVEEVAGPDRVMLVTDAMGAAACGDGAYRLGALDVTVSDGVARVTGTGTIAGSTVTMDRLFRERAILDPLSGRYDDASLAAAARLTAANPARAMGWGDVGDLAPGRRADLVVLSPGLEVREVLHRGEAAGTPSPGG